MPAHIPTPYLLVVDLEATCDQRGFSRDQMETIEVGAVMVETATLRPVDEFQTFIRPVVRHRLTRFCTELTSITQDMVDEAPTFPEAMARWKEWMDGRRSLFCSWGRYDLHQLRQDEARWGCGLPTGRGHLDLKREFASVQEVRRCGMKGALRMAGLPLTGTHHRGIDDARNIAALLPWIVGNARLTQRRR